MDRRSHWETVYKTKSPTEVGWTQGIPEPSLRMIRKLNFPKTAPIIDIGGGDSKLAGFLLDDGYSNITVLDISAAGIERGKSSLGKRAEQVRWVVSDILDFVPDQEYELWHDRAAFHFLTDTDEVKKYVMLASRAASGYITIGTFSIDGPNKCSGLDIRQYDEILLYETFKDKFDLIDSFREDHITPSGNKQNFIFGILKRR